jgi:hypothetical protein
MREIRPSGSEGGVAPTRHPYPYLCEMDAGGPRPLGGTDYGLLMVRTRLASAHGQRTCGAG